VRHPRDIHPEAIAGMCGARIIYGRLETAVASLVRGNGQAVIQLDERFRGTPRERFSTLHETAHLDMHPASDHLLRCTEENGHLGGDTRLLEEDANHFATESSMPEPFAVPLCMAEHPKVDHVDELRATFRASFTSAAIRYVQLSPAPCAFVFCVPARGGGVVKWSVESESFPREIYPRQKLDPRSAAAMAIGKRPGRDRGPREVPPGTWGTSLPLLEHVMPIGPEIGVMIWVTGAW
jgi:hypothetical protein